MLSTCGRGPEPPQVGPGPPRVYPAPRELSAQLAAREGSGAATCHVDAGAGASHPLEASSPARIKCEWLRQTLLPLGTLLQWTESVVRRFIMTSTRGCRG